MKGVNFTTSDKFCIDGKRMFVTSGTYGGDGAEYRTEIADFSKIISYGSSGNGPAWFKVWTKSGLIMELGNTSDSKKYGTGSAVKIWGVSKISDTANNYMAVKYVDLLTSLPPGALVFDNNLYPSKIEYSGNSSVGAATLNYVEFLYAFSPSQVFDEVADHHAFLPVKPDVWQAGSSSRVSTLLHSIYSWSNGEQVYWYDLHYEAGADSWDVARLKDLKFCGKENGAWSCLPETQFTWQNSDLFFTFGKNLPGSSVATNSYLTTADKKIVAGDFNGDGQQDMLHLHPDADPTHSWVALSDGDGTFTFMRSLPGASVTTKSYLNATSSDVLAGDFNGDGLTDILHLHPSSDPKYSWVALSNGDGTFDFQQSLPGATTANNAYLATTNLNIYAGDFNGDGRTDILHLQQNSDPQYSWVGLSDGDGTFTFSRGLPGASTATNSFLNDTDKSIIVGDYNGDGMADLLHLHPNSDAQYSWVALSDGDGTFAFAKNLPGASVTTKSYITTTDRLILPGDINGDGNTDLFHLHPNADSKYSWVAISKGDGTFNFSASLPGATVDNNAYLTLDQQDVVGGDFNGDGWTDFAHLHPSSDSEQSWVAISKGDGYFSFVNELPGAAKSTKAYISATDKQIITGDINGDGKSDLLHLHVDADAAYSWSSIAGVPSPVLMTGVTNGLGVATSVEYKPLTAEGVFAKGVDSNYPNMDAQFSLYVVTKVDSDNGIGGTGTNTYTYEDARLNLEGRGFLGFRALEVTDQQSGMVTRTEYSRTFPYVGLPTLVKQTHNGVDLSKTTTTYSHVMLGTIRYAPHPATVVEFKYDLGGNQVNKVTTTSTYDSWGNPLTIDAVNSDGHRKYTVNTYTNTTSTWIIGRLTKSTVTSTLPSGSAATRTSSFTYDSVTGFITKEIIEPDSTSVQQETKYTYDAFGNKTEVKLSTTSTGSNAFTVRTTKTTYDTNGIFPTKVTNALSQSEDQVYDAKTGKLLSLKGPNGLTTTWAYDGFGRKILETRADGTTTSWTYLECDSSCPSLAAYYIAELASGAPEGRKYFDKLNREIRTSSKGFDGRWVYQDVEYDLNGRVYRASRPYYAGESVYWTTTYYDVMGRPYQIDDNDGSTHITYDGLTTTTTNPKGQMRTEVRNTQGQLASVTDAAGWVLSYTYDPFGNLLTTVDPSGNTIVNTYDIRGRKLTMLDPDMGYWTYEYNALGELTKQTNARQQVTSNTYDLLGRLVTRNEADLITNWYYDKYKDGSACAVGVGKLCETSADNNTGQKTYFDSYGRVAVVTHTIDTTYSAYRTYDSYGRVNTQSVNAVFATRNVYNTNGYLSEVRRDSDNSLLWRADTMDAQGHVTKQTYGNGVVTDRAYNAQNGRLTSILANGPNSAVQNQSYVYDSIGLLSSRSDGVQGSSESFGYDTLNRLTSTTKSGATVSVTYDAIGNITNKSDVGGYTYGGSRPHAVTQAGANTYTYDGNGNMLTGAGRTLTWSSYDMPVQIVEASGTTTFIYNYDHVRVKQTTGSKTVVYLNPRIDLGGHYNKETVGSVVTETFYFYAGGQVVGAYVTKTNTSPQTNYFHADHLGSISVVTDQAGQVIARYEFDPWGKRVLTAGSNATIHGFTGHEHLDDGLIHMNGRIYDPVLGRFMSADPMIQAPDNLQSYNRYSYVMNNPLFYTDPSGYSWFSKLFKKVFAVVAVWYLGPIAFNTGFWGVGTALGGGTAGMIGGTIAGGALAGVTTQLLTTGSTNGWQQAGLTSMLFFGAGEVGSSFGKYSGAHYAAHAAAGCVSAEVGGGSCGRGALSAVAGLEGTKYGPLGSIVAGGTASALSGGKFANGALTASFGYLYNCGLHPGCWASVARGAAYLWGRLQVAVGNMMSSQTGVVITDMAAAEVGLVGAKGTLFASKQAAREALDGDLGMAANRFFRDASKNAQDFRIGAIEEGGVRFEFFSPARNAGYGKLYVQEVDSTGSVVREFKNTIGPNGIVETKWIHGGP